MFWWRQDRSWLQGVILVSMTAIGAVVCIATVALSFSRIQAQAETDASFTASECGFPATEYKNVECGNLAVPEDYDDPGGRRILLHVAIVSSSSKSPDPDPLLILYGGPGANSLDRIDRTIELFAQVLARRDIILFDQRGIGYSQPSLNCPELDNLDVTVIDDKLSNEEEFEIRLLAYRRCRDRLEASGIDLRTYSADVLAADVSALLKELGYDEWNLYGVSYGARQALMLMRDYPDGLRSVVLDSVYPLDVDLAKETGTTHAYALKRLFAANETLHPDFERSFFELVSELDASPIHVPAIIPERWIFPYQSFHGDDLLRLMINIVGRWPQAIPHMPGFIEDINNGNYVDLMQLARPSCGDQMFSEGMNLSVICQDVDAQARKPLDLSHPPLWSRVYDFAEVDATQRMALCELWLGKNRKFHAQAPAVSDIPTLILRGEEDVVIPASWDARVAQDLANDYHISFSETGHGVVNSNSCAREATATFLLEPTRMPDPGCLD